MRLHEHDGRFEIEPSTSAELEKLTALVGLNLSIEPKDSQPTICLHPADRARSKGGSE